MDKAELRSRVCAKILDKISSLTEMISETRAANTETKSSMGDKYETSREMVQQEINRLQTQLKNFQDALSNLMTVSPAASDSAGSGALVRTDRGLFYIAVSAGEIFFNDETGYVISPESPLAKALTGARKGEVIKVNSVHHTVLEIF